MGSNFNFKNYGNDLAAAAGGFPLARQGSIYSLTFDEFQTTLGAVGKDFGSMNMDELLKNIWTAEDSHNHNFVSPAAGGAVNGYLQRQGSITLPRTLSHKTVDEVWRTMSKDTGGSAGAGFGVPQRQPTLGEITIEEFLMRAGVVREETVPAPLPIPDSLMFEFQQPEMPVGNLPMNVNTGNHHIPKPPPLQVPQQQQILPKQPVLPYGSSTTMGIPTSDTLSVHGDRGLGAVGIGANAVTVATTSPALSSDGFGRSNGDISSVSPIPYLYNGSSRGRRTATMEKAVERRQRRMIKNRESAARSRARKQAYTTELEEEVAKLKQEQEMLQKKQEEMLKTQKNQILETMKHQYPAKRRCLKRTHTGPW